MKKLSLFLLILMAVEAAIPTLVNAQVLSGTLSSGIVANYTFDSNLNDSGPQGNNLTDSLGAFSSGFASFGQDRFGNSASMLNIAYAYTQFFSSNTFGLSGNQSFTLSLWVKPTSDIEGIWLAGFGSLASPMSAFAMSFKETWPSPRSPGALAIFNYLPAGVGGIYSDGVTGEFGSVLQSWHMLTAVYSGSFNSTALYLDGQALTVVPTYLSPFHSDSLSLSNTQLIIGVQPNQDIAGNMKGSIDDVVVYSRALSQSEVAELYTAQSVPEPSTYALLLLSGAASLYALKRRRS